MVSGELDRARRLRILTTIRDTGMPKTKKEIAQLTSASLALVGRLVTDLLQEGLLVDTGLGSSSGGRKPQLLGLNPRLGYTVGLDIGGANVRGVASDLSGNVLATLRLPQATEMISRHPLPEMEKIVGRVIAEGGLQRERLLAVGIAISGVIDHAAGICRFCPNIRGFTNMPVAPYFEDRMGVPAVVDDSLRAGAVAEMLFGVARSLDNFLWVGIGIGIGTAIVLNGKVHRGVGGTAGELGHITVKEGGAQCNCGNRGCLEVVASGPAIVRTAMQSISASIQTSLTDIIDRGDPLTVETIASAAREGDKLSYSIIDRTGEYLGIGIATALNLIGLQEVIIAGGVARAGPILIDAIERTIRMRALPALAPRIIVRASGLDELASARGAAWLAADRLFSPEALAGQRSILDVRYLPAPVG